jgi:hypothetical protein
MRLLRGGFAIGFVSALIAVFYMVYLLPPVSWAEWALLTVGVSMLGGIAIGKRWAIGVAFAVNAILSLLLLVTVALLFRHLGHPAFLLVQVIVSTGATAAAVRLRMSFASRFARTS